MSGPHPGTGNTCKENQTPSPIFNCSYKITPNRIFSPLFCFAMLSVVCWPLGTDLIHNFRAYHLNFNTSFLGSPLGPAINSPHCCQSSFWNATLLLSFPLKIFHWFPVDSTEQILKSLEFYIREFKHRTSLSLKGYPACLCISYSQLREDFPLLCLG